MGFELDSAPHLCVWYTDERKLHATVLNEVHSGLNITTHNVHNVKYHIVTCWAFGPLAVYWISKSKLNTVCAHYTPLFNMRSPLHLVDRYSMFLWKLAKASSKETSHTVSISFKSCSFSWRPRARTPSENRHTESAEHQPHDKCLHNGSQSKIFVGRMLLLKMLSGRTVQSLRLFLVDNNYMYGNFTLKSLLCHTQIKSYFHILSCPYKCS